MKRSVLLVVLFSLCLHAFATETKLMVRAKAKDAKFVGSSIGGAHIIVRNSINGEILAEGVTSGSTGNTGLIMKTPIERHSQLTNDETAGFLAVLDIAEPTFVRIEVISPINKRNAQVHASTELWLIPGKDILGDGIVVEIPGFVIDILTPNTHQYIPLESIKSTGLDLKANMVMMCGCPIEKGGVWDSEAMEVKAIVKKDGQTFGEFPLDNPSRNLFATNLKIDGAGHYQILVYAYDPKTGNTGVDTINCVVTE
ncbi:hypothetical protein [Flagellimonas sediminis]|uniref:Uncharacterized protein n=1 Tax=Flagellimonas sediminis TaxID=2696468 RepID=A0A6I5L0T6_9FLAO|nr:hypothetical protein [Allomuricauda sediminis]NDV42660.1 hypothetical protein [Allomuricauda sediminis]